ncbi:MAG: HAD family hydrolase [Verrucomicrobia bacterium]|nr:HAD family hydrolase [Verrucomicrobiota bacterium]
MKQPCIFFDRDGIVNVAPPTEEYYVLSADRFFIEPAFLESLQVVNERGYKAVIVTNQKSVHKGLITLAQIDGIHDRLQEAVADAGLNLDAIYVCPHDDGHPDRKPNPGMLLRAAEDHDIDLSASWMIGDSERDVQAGKAAGCKATVLVKENAGGTDADHVLNSMDELPKFLAGHL